MGRYALACGLSFLLRFFPTAEAGMEPSEWSGFVLLFATSFALAGAAVAVFVEAHLPHRLRRLVLGCLLAPVIAGVLADVILLPWTLPVGGRPGVCTVMALFFAVGNPVGYLAFAGLTALACWSLDTFAHGRRDRARELAPHTQP